MPRRDPNANLCTWSRARVRRAQTSIENTRSIPRDLLVHAVRTRGVVRVSLGAIAGDGDRGKLSV